MLQELKIKNYALLENLRINFDSGLSVLTGETGAGKSILMGALGLLLGDRASSEAIRTGEDESKIDGVFDISQHLKIKVILEDIGIDNDEDHLIISRKIQRDGRNKCYINGSTVTLSMLKQVGDFLVDLHGQHEHQSLLDWENQRDYIDLLGNLNPLQEQVASLYKECKIHEARLKKVINENKNYQDQLDLYRFQLNEIESARLYENEIEELNGELNILENVELLFDNSQFAYSHLYEKEGAVSEILSSSQERLEDVVKIDSSLSETLNNLKEAEILVQEVSFSLQKYLDKLTFDPNRLEEIRTRLNSLKVLEKKYRKSISEIIDLGKNLKSKIATVENFDEEVTKLEEEFSLKQGELSQKALQLSRKRRKISDKIEKLIKSELAELGLENTNFAISFNKIEDPRGSCIIEGKSYFCDEKGLDRVDFLFSANIGEDLLPLAKIASGGEISRFMLAMKSVMASSDGIPTLIFDEIDTGIGGVTTENVGTKLKKLSNYHQVITITHLPQIASKGDNHFAVKKEVIDGRTKTLIKKLTKSDRVKEIARMLGGEKDITIEHAQELLAIKE